MYEVHAYESEKAFTKNKSIKVGEELLKDDALHAAVTLQRREGYPVLKVRSICGSFEKVIRRRKGVA